MFLPRRPSCWESARATERRPTQGRELQSTRPRLLPRPHVTQRRESGSIRPRLCLSWLVELPGLSLAHTCGETVIDFSGIMVSAHPGKVIAVFFDGHAEKIPNDTIYPTGLMKKALGSKPTPGPITASFSTPDNYRTASFSILVLGTVWRLIRPCSSVSMTVATGPTSRTVPCKPATSTESPEANRWRR